MTFSKTLPNVLARQPSRATLVIISMAASLGIATQEANAVTTYQAQVTCPIDGKTFTATMVSSFYQRGARLDSKPLGSLIAPYPFPVCPGNGFVIYQNEFQASEVTAIKAIVLTDEYRGTRREHTDYYMIAYVKERMGGNSYDLGNMYLRASWEAESELPALAQQYRALAIGKFDDFVKNDSSYSEDWWTAAVVAAELDRLLGNFNAVKARLKSLPPAPNRDLTQAINQIRSHASNHNNKVEKFRATEDESRHSEAMR